MTLSAITWDAAALTRAEIRTLKLILGGHTPKRIASMNFVAESTVRRHISNLRLKTGTNSVLQIALWALKARNWE